MKKFFQEKECYHKGYTLIELLVSITIFLLILGVAITVFISIVQYQRRVLYQQQVLNEISYLQEYISKALRMAKTAITEQDALCLGGSEYEGYIYILTRPDRNTNLFRGIKFINASDNDACYEFFLDNTSDPNHPVLKQLKNSLNDSDATPLTSENLKIEFVKFALNGTDGTITNSPQQSGIVGVTREDELQPRVTFLLGIRMLDGNLKIFQTTISQRNLNIIER